MNSNLRSDSSVERVADANMPSSVDVVHYAQLTTEQGFTLDHQVIAYCGDEQQLLQLGLVKGDELPLGRRRSRYSGFASSRWFVNREKGKRLRVWREILPGCDYAQIGQLVAAAQRHARVAQAGTANERTN